MHSLTNIDNYVHKLLNKPFKKKKNSNYLIVYNVEIAVLQNEIELMDLALKNVPISYDKIKYNILLMLAIRKKRKISPTLQRKF